MMGDGNVYYDPQHEAAFGTLEKLKRVAKKTGAAKPGEVKPWLEQQDTLSIARSESDSREITTASISWTCGNVTS